jgi:BirA family transcriptional regulator, biotin operon repressor / biotin---[acetyl-CoA-carboxylase] ligase
MDVDLAHAWQRSVAGMPDEPGRIADSAAAPSGSYADLDRPPLSADVLRRALVEPGSRWSELVVLDETGSTNAVAAERARDPRANGVVVVAEHQTAGRGRLDRTWEAPARSALTVSAVVRPAGVAAAAWPWLPLIAGLAVAAALRRNAEVPATLKWPNDVMVGDRKVGGILVERVDVPDGPPAAVVGIGLNVSQQAEELPVPDATSLLIEGAATLDRSVLLKAVLRGLGGLLTRWEAAEGGVAGLHEAYVDASSTLGRRVRVSLPGGEALEGEAVAVDEVGRLIVRTGSGERSVGAGDVLHLRPQT